MQGVEGFGLNLAYIANSNLHFRLSYFDAGKRNFSWILADDYEKIYVRGTLTLLDAMYFFSKTFYATFGVGQQTYGVDFETKEGTKSGFKVRNLVANIMVGNIWQWPSGFFFGSEWIGYIQPLAGSNSYYARRGPDVAQSSEDKEEKRMKDTSTDRSRRGYLQLAIFRIGCFFK